MGLCFSNDDVTPVRPINKPAQSTSIIRSDPNMVDAPRQVSKHYQDTRAIDQAHAQKKRSSGPARGNLRR